MLFVLNPEEMSKLIHLWEFHRLGVAGCKHEGDAKLEYKSGGGIGTVIIVTCGCGKEMDVTDYHSW